MLLQTFLRASALFATASLLAACAAGTTGTTEAAGTLGALGAPATSQTVGGTLTPQQFADRVELGRTGYGKRPQPFARGVRAENVRPNTVSCTTITPSADVLGALEEPGSTATAAYVIDTPNGTYKKIDYDGSECDIALYIAPTASGITITDSTIHDGIRAGLVVDGASKVKVIGNALYNVGDHSGTTYQPDGVQYGFAMMLDNAGTSETVATNSVFDYQKDGILAFDNVQLALSKNDVTGAGAVNYIASNGIEMDGVAFTSLVGNRDSLNQYTGQYYGASGYLICGDTLGGTPITKKSQVTKGANFAQFNDIEIYVAPNSDCS